MATTGQRQSVVARLSMVLVMLFVAVCAQAGIYESTSRRMAAGDFDNDGVNELAYIRGSGIYVHDFNTPGASKYVPGVTAAQVTAADMDGDGTPEITFINSSTQTLQSYNMATQTLTTYTPAPAAFSTLSAGNATADPSHELMLLATNDAVHTWDNGTYSGSLGGLRQIASGNVNVGANNFKFVGRNAGGAPYGYRWTAGFTGLGGTLSYLTTGNVIANDADDEILATNAGGNVYVNRSGGNWSYTNGTASIISAIGTGRVDGDFAAGRDMAYVVGSGRTLYQSKTNWNSANNGSTGYLALPVDASTSSGAAAGNFGWNDVLVADIDNDGLDEILLRRQYGTYDSLHRFDNGDVGPARVGASTVRGNAAWLKPVVARSGQYSGQYAAERVTDGLVEESIWSGGSSYWLGRNGTLGEWFTIDLLGEFDINQVALRNTHNQSSNDRGTKDFKVYASMDNSTFTQILSGQLPKASGVNGEWATPAHLFDASNGLTPTKARYLKFEAVTSWYPGNHVGLTEFMASEDKNVALGAAAIEWSSYYNASFVPRHITDGRPDDQYPLSYWLAPNGLTNEHITLDLGQSRNVGTIALRNTHNGTSNDRGTRQFRIWGANQVDGGNQLIGPNLILEGTLSASLGSAAMDTWLPTDYFSVANGLKTGKYRYLKFETLSSWFNGNNVGLNEIEVFEDVRSANVAALKPIIKSSGSYSGTYAVSKVTDMRLDEGGLANKLPGISYWLGRNLTQNEWFTLDLERPYTIDRLELQNTHNRGSNDRGTRNFEIWASLEVDGSNDLVNSFLIMAGTMADPRGTNYDIPLDAFSVEAGDFSEFRARYIQFVAKDWWGTAGVGLNEIRVYGSVPEPATMALLAMAFAGLGGYVRKRKS